MCAWYRAYSISNENQKMRHLTVYQRLAAIIAVMSIALFAVSAMQILMLRRTVIEERQTMVQPRGIRRQGAELL